jgi:5-methylcytosine-specific restriction endonuclease McrA
MSFRDYQNPIYKDWRKKVKIRDKNQCKWPNCKNKKSLQVHHILPWSTYPQLRYDINNGILLCKFHHNYIKNDETSYATFFMRLLYRNSLDK